MDGSAALTDTKSPNHHNGHQQKGTVVCRDHEVAKRGVITVMVGQTDRLNIGIVVTDGKVLRWKRSDEEGKGIQHHWRSKKVGKSQAPRQVWETLKTTE